MYFDIFELKHRFFSKICAFASDKGICHIILNPTDVSLDILTKQAHQNSKKFDILQEQLNLYFSGDLKEFCLPLDIQGTNYQKKIWHYLQKIPYGETTSYKQLAMQSESAPRAIGGANKRNKIPIIIPCHRVIHHNGRIGGYFGSDDKVSLKEELLSIERKHKDFVI